MKLSASNAGGQVLSFLALPVLMLYYSPETFGTYATYVSIITMVGSISMLKADQAIVIASDSERPTLITFGIINLLIIVVASMLCCYLLSRVGVIENKKLIIFIPIGILLISAQCLMTTYLTILDKFSLLAINSFLRVVYMIAFQLQQVYLINDLIKLCLGLLLANIITLITMLLLTPRINMFKFQNLKLFIIYRHRNLLLFSTLSGLINSLSANLPLYFITIYFGAGVAGFYAIAQRIIVAPITVFSNAVTSTFYATCAKEHQAGRNLSPIIFKTLGICSLASLGLLIFIIGFGETFFITFLKESWHGSIDFISAMVFWTSAVLIGAPITKLASILDFQEKVFILDTVMISFRLLSIIIIGWAFADALITVKSFVLVSCIIWTVWTFYIIFRVKNHDKNRIR